MTHEYNNKAVLDKHMCITFSHNINFDPSLSDAEDYEPRWINTTLLSYNIN